MEFYNSTLELQLELITTLQLQLGLESGSPASTARRRHFTEIMSPLKPLYFFHIQVTPTFAASAPDIVNDDT